MRLVRRASIAIGWLAISIALLRIGSGGGGTADNIRYAIADLPPLLVVPAAITLAVSIALVVGVLTERRIGRASLVAALASVAIGLALEQAGHGSGVPVAAAASLTVALSLGEARAEQIAGPRTGRATTATPDEPDGRV